jgi:hypothetical protein
MAAQCVTVRLSIKQIGHLSTGFTQPLPQALWTTCEGLVVDA